jgi:hypothetical protein
MKSKLLCWGLGIFVIVTGVVMLVVGTSEYLLGCRHANEIVAAGEELMALAEEEGKEIIIDDPLNDPRVPAGLQLLAPVAIQVLADEVYVYTGGHSGKGFFIYKRPHEEPPVGSDSWRINSRLWWYEGA